MKGIKKKVNFVALRYILFSFLFSAWSATVVAGASSNRKLAHLVPYICTGIQPTIFWWCLLRSRLSSSAREQHIVDDMGVGVVSFNSQAAQS